MRWKPWVVAIAATIASPPDARGQDFDWVATAHNSSANYATGLATDSDRRVIEAGWMSGNSGFLSPGGLVPWGWDDSTYLRVLGPDRDLHWIAYVNQTINASSIGLSVDADGHMLLAGRARQMAVAYPAVGDSFQLINAGDPTSPFVWKLDRSGASLWSRVFPATGHAYVTDVDTLTDGTTLVAGYFTATLDIDPGPDRLLLTSQGDADLFMAALDRDGHFLWGQRFGGNGPDQMRDLAVTEDGTILLVGRFSDVITLDTMVEPIVLTSMGDTDGFILQLDGDGNALWAGSMGGPAADSIEDIAMRADGGMILVGRFQETARLDPEGVFTVSSQGENDGFVTALDESHTPVWARRIGGGSNDMALAAAVGSLAVYVGGRFSDTVDFGNGVGPALASAGAGDAFLMRLDQDGQFEWITTLGGDSLLDYTDVLPALGVDRSGAILAAGGFAGDVDFDPAPDTSFLAYNDSSFADGFIWKLLDEGALQFGLAGNVGEIRVGDDIQLTISVTNTLNALTLTDLGFVQTLPVNLHVAPEWNGAVACGGGVTVAPDRDAIYLAGASLESGEVCDLAVPLLATGGGRAMVESRPADVITAEGVRPLAATRWHIDIERAVSTLEIDDSSPSPSRPGEPVAFFARVPGIDSIEAPSGIITVASAGRACFIYLPASTHCSIDFDETGSHPVTISYSGDANYEPAEATLVHDVMPFADLGMQLLAPSGLITGGAQVNLELTVSNQGPDPADDARLQADLFGWQTVAWNCLSGCIGSGSDEIDLHLPLHTNESARIGMVVLAPSAENLPAGLDVRVSSSSTFDSNVENGTITYRAVIGLFADGFD